MWFNYTHQLNLRNRPELQFCNYKWSIKGVTMVKRYILSIFIIFPLIVGCSRVPATFIKTYEPTWASIELRKDVDFETAWKSVYDILIRQFDVEIAQKENGYIRTGWVYTWTGQYTDYYRVRVTIKFDKDKNTIDVKSEAYYRDYIGYDTRLVETLKTDIMGSIGRTTR